MYCPNPSCQESTDRPRLAISERAGIEIDYCPQCRGVWLDRGELDKLIERAQAEAAPEPSVQITPPPQQQDYRNQQHQAHYQQGHYQQERHHKDAHYKDDQYKNQGYGHHGKHRKKSLLSEIFDF